MKQRCLTFHFLIELKKFLCAKLTACKPFILCHSLCLLTMNENQPHREEGYNNGDDDNAVNDDDDDDDDEQQKQ